MQMTIGFIGLGRMGAGMAKRLLAGGHRVVGFDTDPTALQQFTDAGGHAANSVLELANQAQIVFASLPSLASSEHVALGPGGVVEGQAVKIYVETSTIGRAQAAKLAQELRRVKGIEFLDAPISGGPKGADDGTLTTVVAGSRSAFDSVEPLLHCMAAHIVYAGEEPGLGQLYKVVNNYIVMSTMAATCEAVAMGVRAGADEARLVDVINHATGKSYTSSVKFPSQILPRTPAPSLHMAIKDVHLYTELAAEFGHVSVCANGVLDSWETASLSNQSVVQWYESLLKPALASNPLDPPGLLPQDRLNIQDLHNKYIACIDSGDVEGWLSTFSSNGAFHHPARVYAGTFQLREFISTRSIALESHAITHQRHWNRSLSISKDLGGARATCELAVTGVDRSSGKPVVVAVGRYEDKLVREAAGWRFALRTLTLS